MSNNRPFIISSIIVVLLLVALYAQELYLEKKQHRFVVDPTVTEDVLLQEALSYATLYKVTLVDSYLCGSEDITYREVYAPSLEVLQLGLKREYNDNYQVQKIEENEIRLTNEHANIHPDMLGNILFGINARNQLVIYHQDETPNHPMNEFFPIEVDWIPEEQIAQLEKGIVIHDLEDYHSVLSTFNEYIIEYPFSQP
ncbi:hypothetical protein BHU72_09240 [Desulfuribacillus stibiiarsenatis]|uniref:Bypass of forespore C C-terminal domain-containing protein n=1 Tax=Desulfuribacillus stibiiarsenatis TaxID=1390249 RepID=A0A1E5L2V7_9FIRM|nr:BofC C-terminal domain-containing protein [Desulfuribacillus stibiiarsenatis]OEH84393.1 hypothetical protein BHU72_09240 [Desulfuribacillus stibiiarsenatis]